MTVLRCYDQIDVSRVPASWLAIQNRDARSNVGGNIGNRRGCGMCGKVFVVCIEGIWGSHLTSLGGEGRATGEC